ncbi:hypothetical protein SORBI_3009G178550 [Sorghum bicolor]|uniref:Uncharacterized protein n=1 Tax=Sorghum bicolor TaxID=4558 RepID=A0A1Z5R3W6_SORBI|nr:hypothetical protein SORBI_3009G178550 [Sorghum bicolor]
MNSIEPFNRTSFSLLPSHLFFCSRFSSHPDAAMAVSLVGGGVPSPPQRPTLPPCSPPPRAQWPPPSPCTADSLPYPVTLFVDPGVLTHQDRGSGGILPHPGEIYGARARSMEVAEPPTPVAMVLPAPIPHRRRRTKAVPLVVVVVALARALAAGSYPVGWNQPA